jgi:hypothetical protein
MCENDPELPGGSDAVSNRCWRPRAVFYALTRSEHGLGHGDVVFAAMNFRGSVVK